MSDKKDRLITLRVPEEMIARAEAWATEHNVKRHAAMLAAMDRGFGGTGKPHRRVKVPRIPKPSTISIVNEIVDEKLRAKREGRKAKSPKKILTDKLKAHEKQKAAVTRAAHDAADPKKVLAQAEAAAAHLATPKISSRQREWRAAIRNVPVGPIPRAPGSMLKKPKR